MTRQALSDEIPQSRIEDVAESIYRLLPAHVRLRDAEEGGALRALIGILAQPSAEIDIETERFYDALFVETAPEAALEHIGALVGAPILIPNPGVAGLGMRALVANTIRYRRGKGTARVIEALSADASGLGAIAVEYYQRLSRLAHTLDLRPERPATAFVVAGDSAQRAQGAFDFLPRLLDLRRVEPVGRRGPAGRHGIASLGVHLHRSVTPAWPAPDRVSLSASDLADVPPMHPWAPGGIARVGYFQLSAQPDQTLRLFNPDRRSDVNGQRPGQTHLPGRLSRLPLHLETQERRLALLEGRPARLPEHPWFDDRGHPFTIYLRRGAGAFIRVPPEQIRIVNLETAPPAGGRPVGNVPHRWFTAGQGGPIPHEASAPITCVFDPVTGRLITSAPVGAAPEVSAVRIAYATGIGRPIGAGPQDRNTVTELFDVYDQPDLSNIIRWVDEEASETGTPSDSHRSVHHLATALEEVKVLGAGRRSLIIALRCGIEPGPGGPSPLEIHIAPESDVQLIAAKWRFPRAGPTTSGNPPIGFIIRRDRRLTINVPVVVRRTTPAPAKRPGRLLVDGIEFTQGLTLSARSVAELRLRHVTLRAPGALALRSTGDLAALAIRLEQCICGPVALGAAAPDVTGRFSATDCIFASDGRTGPALALPELDTDLCNVTVMAEAELRSLSGTNVIFAAPVKVTRRQSGCLRFSYVPLSSKVPQAYRCQPDLAVAGAAGAKGAALDEQEKDLIRQSVVPSFLDEALDEPLVAMLHALCPDQIIGGGEGGTEMGAFSANAFEIVRTNLHTLLDEYTPFALDAGVIDDTQSSAAADRRNRP